MSSAGHSFVREKDSSTVVRLSESSVLLGIRDKGTPTVLQAHGDKENQNKFESRWEITRHYRASLKGGNQKARHTSERVAGK